MEWKNLLSSKRIGRKIIVNDWSEKKYPRSEFEKDYRRIINSASFRRMQDKTQVFPLDQSDFVRTRLTHSFEVSALAKALGVMLLSVLKEKEPNLLESGCPIDDIPTILSCSGLLHDIGNPPFGHFGEEIIKKWFSCNLSSYSISHAQIPKPIALDKLLSQMHCNDLLHFDGNAQALRVLTKLHFQDDDNGLNLTAAVLNTLIKYPTASNDVKSKEDTDYSLINKKMGYTESDTEIFKKITEETGAGKYRHPLAFVLEAADDIAYKTADIEDAYKKGLFSLDELHAYVDSEIEKIERKNPGYKEIRYVKELFEQLEIFCEQAYSDKYQKEIDNPGLYAVQNWVPHAQEWLMYCAIYGFDSHYSLIMDGQYKNDLFYETNHYKSVDIIDSVMQKFIFPNRNIVKLELSANTILSDLLSKFLSAALYHDKLYVCKNHVETQAYKKLYGLISDNYIEAYKMSLNNFKKDHHNDEIIEYDIYLRILLVVDYISGMTDGYAKSLYQELNGINGLSGIY